MGEPVVIGSKNQSLRRLKRLVGRTKARSEERAFVVDGPVLVADALRSGLQVTEIFAGPGVLEEYDLLGLIDGDQNPDVAVYQADPSVLAAALDPVNPRPLAAVVSAPTWTLADLPIDRPILVAVELRDPGNLGAVLRTAEGAGLGGVVVVGASVDPLSPKVVRASAGSIFRLPVVRCPDVAEAMEAIRTRGWPLLMAVVSPDAKAHDALDLTAAAIVVGNEPHGLADDTIRLGDGQFTIPLAPSVESLNVAAAAAVLCFEAARQRRSGRPGPASASAAKSVGQQDGEASGLYADPQDVEG